MSEPIRVLQLAKHFYPDTGGIETATLDIADLLLERNIQADVLSTEFMGPYPTISRGYHVIRCRANLAVGNKRLSLEYVRRGRELESHYDCALVHVPNPLAMLVALSWRKPVILLWHADIPQTLVRWATAPLDWAVLRKAASIIGPTPVHLESSHWASAMNREQTVTIPFPFDRSRIPSPTGRTPFVKRIREFRRGRPLSISIGRLVPYKGFDVLIEAATMFDDRLCALIVGKGPLERDLQQLIDAKGVGNRVMLAGPLSGEELADALTEAHIGCMPSVTSAEMYGLAQVESMAAGLPMVSSDLRRSGVPYVNKHGKTGLNVPPGDPVALASAMLQLVNNKPLWRSLRDGALWSVEHEHDRDAVGDQYAKLIRRICQRETASQ